MRKNKTTKSRERSYKAIQVICLWYYFHVIAQILVHITNAVTAMNLLDPLGKEGVRDLFLVEEMFFPLLLLKIPINALFNTISNEKLLNKPASMITILPVLLIDSNRSAHVKWEHIATLWLHIHLCV